MANSVQWETPQASRGLDSGHGLRTALRRCMRLPVPWQSAAYAVFAGHAAMGAASRVRRRTRGRRRTRSGKRARMAWAWAAGARGCAEPALTKSGSTVGSKSSERTGTGTSFEPERSW